MAELAQGYLHLKPFSFSSDIERLGDKILRDASEAASKIYDFPVTVDIRIEEGSLKFWGGVVASLYGAVAVYPDFKDGAAELYVDAKEFGTAIIESVKKEIHPSPSVIYRAERRTKDVGRIHRLYKRLDKAEKGKFVLNPSTYSEEMASIRVEFENLLGSLSADDARILSQNTNISLDKGRPASLPRPKILSDAQFQLLKLEQVRSTPDVGRLIYRKAELVNISPKRVPLGIGDHRQL